MLNYLLAGLLGITFFFLGQANEVRKDFKANNIEFIPVKFLRDELISILIHIVAVLILAITVNEWSSYSAVVQKYITCIFALGGIIGPWLISLIASKSKKYVRTVADIKSNIVDNEMGKSETITELKQKASEQGKDITPPTK